MNASEPWSGPMPIEPDKTQVEVSALLNGKPFPAPHAFVRKSPGPKRTLYAAGRASEGGDGSEARPWSDLQKALRALSPGDRLVVKAGVFPGAFRVDQKCRDGSKESPIEVVFEGAILQPTTQQAALSIRRAHWAFIGLWVVLGSAGAPAVSVEGPGGHDLLIRSAQIYQGAGSGIVLGPGCADVTVAEAHVHNLGLLSLRRPSFGVDILAGARGVTVTSSKLHHNSGGSVRIGSGPGDPPSGVTIVGNRIHNDRRPGVLVVSGSDVRIADNQLYNYRPVGGTWGQAIVVDGGEGVAVEGNHVAESTVGVQIGRADPSGSGPLPVLRRVSVRGNYLENRLTSDAAAVVLETGIDVRVENNVTDQYARGLFLLGSAPSAGQWSAAGNLLLGLSETAFLIADPQAVSSFDGNAFSAGGPDVGVIYGSETVPLAGYLARGTMPQSILLTGAALEGRDLGRVKGLPAAVPGSVRRFGVAAAAAAAPGR